MEDPSPFKLCPPQWRDDNALPLTVHTALAYFARSPFCDPGWELGGGTYALRPPRSEEAALGLFVVEARSRTSGQGDVVEGAFAILQGTVLPAPSLRGLVHARAAFAAVHVTRAIAALRLLEDAEGAEREAAASSTVVAQQPPLLPADRVDALIAGLTS